MGTRVLIGAGSAPKTAPIKLAFVFPSKHRLPVRRIFGIGRSA
jgi:hypothetical protein